MILVVRSNSGGSIHGIMDDGMIDNTADGLGFRMSKAEHHRMAAPPVKVQAILTWAVGRGPWAVVTLPELRRIRASELILHEMYHVCRCFNHRHSRAQS